ncbi:helix-turn-helix transcriptional regulator [Streptomyces roseoverticillatus]|uniref:helix-turn-helix domain-containing protein n=1 Tax=Streptomyces roseoverticillatus TaxID=66429 RepID=UPI0033CE0122
MIRTDILQLAWVRDAALSGTARQARTEAHLTLSEIAELCEVDPSTVWRWEQGMRAPRGEAALRYARVLQALACRDVLGTAA